MFSTLEFLGICPREMILNILRNNLAKASGQGGDTSYTNRAQVTVYAHDPSPLFHRAHS